MLNKVIRTRISEELKKTVVKIAGENCYSESEFVRQAIREKCERHKRNKK